MARPSMQTLKDLELTRDEVERLTDALKDKQFRKLLVDYVEEIRDPDNQKLYQQEITQLEKERGVDVTFINPIAGYVIKTSVDGATKGFINICANEHVGKPTSVPAVQEGSRGLHWQLPHSLAPPREDYDKKGAKCRVFDVVFHPDTLHLAAKNKTFRDMVNKTACDAVESNFDISLDKKNLKFPKLQYKGFPNAAVVRKPSLEHPPELTPEEKEVMDKFYAGLGEYPAQEDTKKKARKTKKKKEEEADYTTPTYVMKHRRHVELEEFTDHKNCKMNAATPKELVVEVNLPLLKSSADIVLDVTEKTLQLVSEKPARYKLSLTLPYKVNQDCGNAKFDKDQKKLIVTLPVKQSRGIVLTDVVKDDSGVESDHSLTSSSPVEEIDSVFVQETEQRFVVQNENNFLNPDLHYLLPEFTAHAFDNNIAFTLTVKNVDGSSVSKRIEDDAVHIKFTSVSAGFFPAFYAFFVKLPTYAVEADKLSVDVWDNNVIVQISCDRAVASYWYGVEDNNLLENWLSDALAELSEPEHADNETDKPEGTSKNEESKKPKKEKKKSKNKKRNAETTPETETEEEDEKFKIVEITELKQSSAIDIIGSYSECSSDEISHSFSPTKSRGILKGFSNNRRFGRSISESGLDDVGWSSIENCHASVDSVIPEEGETSTSLKKTVRFNDVVSRQLFRSNSSILGQRKKNQRKAKAKKRAQERRHSEGEISEEEKKEREAETANIASNANEQNGPEGNKKEAEQKAYFGSDIFELDMN